MTLTGVCANVFGKELNVLGLVVLFYRSKDYISTMMKSSSQNEQLLVRAPLISSVQCSDAGINSCFTSACLFIHCLANSLHSNAHSLYSMTHNETHVSCVSVHSHFFIELSLLPTTVNPVCERQFCRDMIAVPFLSNHLRLDK